MANPAFTLPILLAQWRALDAAFPGFDDPALEAQWNEHMDLLECAIARTRPVSVECVADAIAFAEARPENPIAGALLRHCAQLLRAA